MRRARLPGPWLGVDDQLMADSHCSRCCPVPPPKPAVRLPTPPAAYVWTAAVVLAVVGTWLGAMWLLGALAG